MYEVSVYELCGTTVIKHRNSLPLALGGECDGKMHLGLFVCLSVCPSGRMTQELLLRLTFFTREVLYPWLGPPLR